MKQKMKTEKVFSAFVVLSTAKYEKLSDEEKIKVWKIARALKPVAAKFEEDSKDAAEKLVPYKEFPEDLQRAEDYRIKIKKPDLDPATLPMGAAEYSEFLQKQAKYQKTVNDAMKEFAQAEVEVNFEPITEETFQKLMNSNDWNFGQVTNIGDVIVK